MKTCEIEGCGRPHQARGYCGMHYQRARKAGEFAPVPQYTDAHDLLQRNTVMTDRGCWEWTGKRSPDGYGITKHLGRDLYAHRLSYETYVEAIPTGLQIDHLCRNEPCVRPDHLEPVTGRVNTLRGTSPAALNAQKTHCKRDHEFTPENTRAAGRDLKGRRCKTCESSYDRRRRSAIRSAA